MEDDAPPPTPPAQDAKVEVLGVALQVRTLRHRDPPPAGARAPTLVFLHECLGSIEIWRDFPERLARLTGLDALVYDRQGHGRSPPLAGARTDRYLHDEALEVLPALLDRCGVGEAILVGHSDGGSIALLAAAGLGERIAGVITEGAHVFVEEETLAGIREADRAYESTDLRAKLARRHGDKADALHRTWIETWLSPSFRGWSIEDCLPSIRCPVLAIQGLDDEYGTPGQVRSIVGQVAGRSRSLLIPGCRHVPHRQAPEIVEREVAGFVRELTSDRRDRG
jgi:pimeloyl-ACP methyl ester carboxylesterase